MPCPCTGLKMFWAGPNFLCQTKNLFTYCGSHKYFVPRQKDDLRSVNWHKIFCRGTQCSQIFEAGSKKFGPALNILGLAKGQGIRKLTI